MSIEWLSFLPNVCCPLHPTDPRVISLGLEHFYAGPLSPLLLLVLDGFATLPWLWHGNHTTLPLHRSALPALLELWHLLWTSYLLNFDRVSSCLLQVLVAQSFLTLCNPPWTVAHQVPLSMGFSRQEDWSGLPCTSPTIVHLFPQNVTYTPY